MFCRSLQKIFLLFLFQLFAIFSFAQQLCTGSLGDPVINKTFGSGPNPGPQLNNTSYFYAPTGCPPDGQYAIRSDLYACFSNSWHDIVQDHTPGDANGYCMIVNASFTPGDFFVDTVKGLCDKTTYEFAAWVLNILKPSACNGNGIQPIVNFNIETTTGTVLGNYNTGNIPSTNTPEWKQYGLFFTTPIGVSDVVVRMTNNAPGGCGNDIVLDDITFRACGPTVNATIMQGSGGSSTDLCDGSIESFPLTASISGGYVNPEYQWQLSTDGGITWTNIAGATSTTYLRTPTPIGMYNYRLAVAEQGNINSLACKVVSNILTVSVNKNPVPAATNNGPICENSFATLSASDGATFNWTGPNVFTSSQQQPQVKAIAAAAGKYYVNVISSKNCSTKDSTILQVIPGPKANAGLDIAVCEGDNANLSATGGISYLWTPVSGLSNPAIANPVATVTDTTIYTVFVKDAIGCSDSDAVSVNVIRKPVADAGSDKVIVEGQSIQLNGTVNSTALTYLWSPLINISDPTILNPLVSPTSDQTYILTANSTMGCGFAYDSTFVRVYKKILVPNAFSPNGDGIYDTWNIEALFTYADASVEVYNRYGQLVFHCKGYGKNWDGTFNNKPLPVGTYYYLIDLKNGTPVLRGSVTIIR